MIALGATPLSITVSLDTEQALFMRELLKMALSDRTFITKIQFAVDERTKTSEQHIRAQLSQAEAVLARYHPDPKPQEGESKAN